LNSFQQREQAKVNSTWILAKNLSLQMLASMSFQALFRSGPTPFKILLAGLLLLPATARAVDSPAVRDQYVVARVIGEKGHLRPGEPYRIGLLLSHDAGWHTYWKSTATGYGPSIEWDLPQGVSVSELSWPTPRIYTQGDLIDYVYEDKVLLVVTLSTPDTLDASSLAISYRAEWLMCEKVCIPGGASGTLTLPVSADPPSPSKWSTYFARHDQSLPAASAAHQIQAWKSGQGIILEVQGPLPAPPYTFFDATASLNPESTATVVLAETDRLHLRLSPDASANAFPEKLDGVLAASDPWPGTDGLSSLTVAIPIQPTSPIASAAMPLSIGLLFFAFLGGLILNLMPCVFPVLGIKIMGFVEHAGADPGKVIRHGLVFTGGVLLSFWILALVLLVLRSGGSQLGWGFQLQSPAFVLCLTILLFAFGLNMFGLFEFGQSAVGVGAGLTVRQGYSGSFFSGVLATVVATPCAAPFLAPALGAALALPPLASFAVFTAIAIGLSLPYLLLSAFPSMVKRLPRPGPWMESFKQSMSFLLFATVAFLLWVLAGQLTDEGGYSPSSFLKVLLSLVVIALALWIFGRWGAYHKPAKTKITATTAAVLLIAASFWMGLRATQAPSLNDPAISWQKWEPGLAEELARDGKLVYLDFTARWCVTCQTNKAAVFSSETVRDRFLSGEAIALKADWTQQDPQISEELAKFGRSAVPFNLVYGPSLERPLVLPELLTPQIVLDAMDHASGKRLD
jgi:thiol:disulfide interchange protein